MKGGRGEVGYEIVVEGAVECIISSKILGCRSACSNG